jgi:hypothetical protein
MKDAEDEAFDELAKKQGSWGGGFQAKRAMAADKLQQPAPNKKRPIESDYTSYVAYTRALERLCDTLLAQPAQEPVARVSGVYGGRFTYDPINRAAILPVGMALYAAPPAQDKNT